MARKRKAAAEATAPLIAEPPKPTCKIEQVLTTSTIKLLKQAPENAVNRTLALAALKKPIPDEVKSFEAIKDWIEHNFNPAKVPPVDTTKPAVVAFAGNYNYSREETGSCRYTRHLCRNGRMNLDSQVMDQLITQSLENGEGWDDFVHRVQVHMINILKATPPPGATYYGACETHDHEVEDQQEAHVEVSRTNLNDYLYNWMETYRRDASRELCE